jgi:hypothetical protein
MTLVSSFLELVQQLACVMTTPTFNTLVAVLTGWVFARRRTVTGMILAADAVGTKHHSSFHRLFAKAEWCLDDLGLAVFGLIEPWLSTRHPVMLALDDTLARKRGLKVYGAGMHQDPMISTRKVPRLSWSHSWVVLSVIVRFPCCPEQCIALPILFRLYINKQTVARKGGWYRTRPELAVDLMYILCRAHENRRFHVVADSTYGGQNVLGDLPENCDLTSRLNLDARLYEAPPPRKPGTNGRPRKRGVQLPSPRQMLTGRANHRALDIYGRRDKVRMIDCVARAHAVPDRPLRIVAIEPLTGGRREQAFYSTRYEASAEQVLTWYAMRWSIEVAFQSSKTHLGFEEPQGWTRRAVERTAPTAMLLHTLIVLWFARCGHRHYRQPERPWYQSKRHASFADMLTTLRRESIREQVLSTPPSRRGNQKILAALLHAVQQAA